MRRVFLVLKILRLALGPKLHVNDEAGVVDFLLRIFRLLSVAVMLWCLMVDNLMELLIVLLEPLLFLITQQLLRGCQDILIAQICDIAYAVIFKPLILQLDPLHQILLFAMHFDMLLADKLEELAHLLNRWLFALAIIPTARTEPIVLFLFCVKNMSDDGLQLRWEIFL